MAASPLLIAGKERQTKNFAGTDLLRVITVMLAKSWGREYRGLKLFFFSAFSSGKSNLKDNKWILGITKVYPQLVNIDML